VSESVPSTARAMVNVQSVRLIRLTIGIIFPPRRLTT
jgi:hypothetical protein